MERRHDGSRRHRAARPSVWCAGSVIVRLPANTSGELAGVQHDRGHLRLGDADFDPRAGEPRIDRVIVAIEPNERLHRHPDHLPPIDNGHPRGHRPHPRLLLSKPLGRDRPDRPVHPAVGFVGPRVEPILEVEMVREHATGLEVRTHEPMRALECPLRLQIPRLEDHPPQLQPPAESGERLRRAATRANRGLPVPHQLLRQRTNPAQIPGQTPEDVRRLL